MSNDLFRPLSPEFGVCDLFAEESIEDTEEVPHLRAKDAFNAIEEQLKDLKLRLSRLGSDLERARLAHEHTVTHASALYDLIRESEAVVRVAEMNAAVDRSPTIVRESLKATKARLQKALRENPYRK